MPRAQRAQWWSEEFRDPCPTPTWQIWGPRARLACIPSSPSAALGSPFSHVASRSPGFARLASAAGASRTHLGDGHSPARTFRLSWPPLPPATRTGRLIPSPSGATILVIPHHVTPSGITILPFHCHVSCPRRVSTGCGTRACTDICSRAGGLMVARWR